MNPNISQTQSFFIPTSLWTWNSVPKPRHIKFRRRAIAQKKAYNILGAVSAKRNFRPLLSNPLSLYRLLCMKFQMIFVQSLNLKSPRDVVSFGPFKRTHYYYYYYYYYYYSRISASSLPFQSNNNNNNNNNIYLLQLGCHPVAVVILHVNKTWIWLLLNLSREGYIRSM